MTINKIHPENMSKKTLYALTRGQSIQAKNMDDRTSIKPVAFVEYTDTNAKGEENTILAIRDGNSGEVISTISKTFQRDFYDALAFMDGDDFEIHTVHGTTKAGRDFVTCTVVCDELDKPTEQ